MERLIKKWDYWCLLFPSLVRQAGFLFHISQKLLYCNFCRPTTIIYISYQTIPTLAGFVWQAPTSVSVTTIQPGGHRSALLSSMGWGFTSMSCLCRFFFNLVTKSTCWQSVKLSQNWHSVRIRTCEDWKISIQSSTMPYRLYANQFECYLRHLGFFAGY